MIHGSHSLFIDLRRARQKLVVRQLAELCNLRRALLGLTDTRNPKAIRHPFSAMLTLIVYGLRSSPC